MVWEEGLDGELYVDSGNGYKSQVHYSMDLGDDFEFALTFAPYHYNSINYQIGLNATTDGVGDDPCERYILNALGT